MRVFVDLDGVIVDFTKGIIEWYDMPCTSEDFTTWGSVFNCFTGTEEQFWNNLTNTFWSNLEFTKEAEEILTLLKPLKPCILTSPPHNAAGGKQDWIRKNLPDYFKNGRYLIGPAKHYLAHEQSLLIDDADENVSKFRKAGGHAILIPRPWNELHGEDVLHHLEGELKNDKILHRK